MNLRLVCSFCKLSNLPKLLILLLVTFSTSADPQVLQDKKSFIKPSIIGFMGIPASGKSTIAIELANLLDAEVYLEGEENNYPNEIKKGFLNRDKEGVALNLYKYFRDIRVKNLKLAIYNKQQGRSSILDSVYDKLFYDLLGRNGVDKLVNPNHADFAKIESIAYEDKNSLPDMDIIVFLKVSRDLYGIMQQARGRKFDVEKSIFEAQESFLAVTSKYAQEKGKILIVLDQQNDVKIVVRKLLRKLKKLKVIKE